MVQTSFLSAFTDSIDEGLIYIDESEKIQLYNKRAREIFGIVEDSGRGHASGQIQAGDLILLADHRLFGDDGMTDPSPFASLGLPAKALNRGDSIVAISRQGDTRPLVYAHKAERENRDLLEVHAEHGERVLSAALDFTTKQARLSVGDATFTMPYIRSVGHLLILDGETLEVKFYQAKGYTARRETLADLLAGRPYAAKGRNQEIEVLGRHPLEIHDDSEIIRRFVALAGGLEQGEQSIRNGYYEINGRPALCTLKRIAENGTHRGALLIVEDLTELEMLIAEKNSALDKLAELERQLGGTDLEEGPLGELVGDSESIRLVRDLAHKASMTTSTVLIEGESGTGKTLLASLIHKTSGRATAPFVHVNCASIPESLIESELFGYEGGAFTGATSSGKRGFFEEANGGTLFLDEIGELPLGLQAKLLGVLQNRSFFRVGGTKAVTVDVRIIAASNRDLAAQASKGLFREDLYYRVSVFPILIPPLRSRFRDIGQIARHLLPRLTRKLGVGAKQFSQEALERLTTHHWPGNIRELENAIERAINLTPGTVIDAEAIQFMNPSKATAFKPLKELLEETEKEAIERALKLSGGDRHEAMRRLGIRKSAFYEKMSRYRIEVSK